jgi:hypothetical protein
LMDVFSMAGQLLLHPRGGRGGYLGVESLSPCKALRGLVRLLGAL